MASFGDFASGLIGANQNAQAGQLQGQADAQKINTGNFLDVLKLLQQKHEQENADALNKANVNHLNTESDLLRNPVAKPKDDIVLPEGAMLVHPDGQGGSTVIGQGAPKPVPPRNIDPLSPEGLAAEGKRAKTNAQATADAAIVPVTNTDGSTSYVTRTQALGMTPPNKAGGGAAAQSQQARMMAAMTEAQLADKRMRDFEDGLLSGKTKISPLQQAGGTLTTNLSGTHSPIGALMQSGSEAALNATSPEYSQYLRDAATIGRAEQMMSPRGGNETMVRANALLSRAGTGAMANTITASRQARQALFGPSGGIQQTLSPTQSQKLATGVANIRAGESGQSKAPSPAQALWDAAVAKHGQAKVLAEYGPRPDDE